MKLNNLGAMLCQFNSRRTFAKNYELVNSIRLFERVILILKKAGCDTIIISTDECTIVPEIAERYNVEALIRPQEWANHDDVRTVAKMSIKHYEENTGIKFDDYTVIFGTAVFWRPSWIREAIRVIREYKFAEVKPYKSPECCICFARQKPEMKAICYRLQHYGINLDIDHPEDMHLAKQLMNLIMSDDGELDYDLNETYHEKYHVTPRFPLSEPVRLDECHYYDRGEFYDTP